MFSFPFTRNHTTEWLLLIAATAESSVLSFRQATILLCVFRYILIKIIFINTHLTLSLILSSFPYPGFLFHLEFVVADAVSGVCTSYLIFKSQVLSIPRKAAFGSLCQKRGHYGIQIYTETRQISITIFLFIYCFSFHLITHLFCFCFRLITLLHHQR